MARMPPLHHPFVYYAILMVLIVVWERFAGPAPTWLKVVLSVGFVLIGLIDLFWPEEPRVPE